MKRQTNFTPWGIRKLQGREISYWHPECCNPWGSVFIVMRWGSSPSAQFPGPRLMFRPAEITSEASPCRGHLSRQLAAAS